MQDGTKIKALASSGTDHREGTIREHRERARQRVRDMGDPRNQETSLKAKQAQAGARREQQERLEDALEELQKLRARKTGEKTKSEGRVSIRDRQARVIKQSDGGLARSDNAQISTAAAQGLIVGAAVMQEAGDSAQPWPAVDRVEQRLKKKPRQIVADGGYTTPDHSEKLAGRKIDFLGSRRWDNVPSGATTPHGLPPRVFIYQPETNRYVCPRGKILHPQGPSRKRPGLMYHR